MPQKRNASDLPLLCRTPETRLLVTRLLLTRLLVDRGCHIDYHSLITIHRRKGFRLYGRPTDGATRSMLGLAALEPSPGCSRSSPEPLCRGGRKNRRRRRILRGRRQGSGAGESGQLSP